MKRPILIAVIGYIIGIIMGLYFKISIVLFYILIIASYIIYKRVKKTQVKKFKLISIRRYCRYIKIYLQPKVIIIILISSVISNIIVICQNRHFENICNSLEKDKDIDLVGIVISEKQEKQYYNIYKIETKYNNKKIRLYITINKKINLEYGDKIVFSGKYIEPEVQRNYKGFDYLQYLKQLKVYGTIRCDSVEIINKNQTSKLLEISNHVSEKIKENIKMTFDKETSALLIGLLLGDKSKIGDEIQKQFRNASISHILAVSGMHVSYIILGINMILKDRIGKRNTNILSIIILIFYMVITNFSPSVTRAVIMGIIMILSKLIYRKNDIYTTISISLFIILIYNPFLIQNLGIQLSYSGVIGIVLLHKAILSYFNNIKVKNKAYKYIIRPKIQKILDKIKEIISVSISVQIFILPIIFYNMNTFNPYFLISNLILSIIIGPIVIAGFLFIIVSLINLKLSQTFSIIVKIGIQLLITISKIGNIPISKIYVSTPSLYSIIIYYLFIVVLFAVCKIYLSQKPNKTQIRARNLLALIQIKIRQNRKKFNSILIVSILIFLFIHFIPSDLQIHFIDVGQGDSTLIVTPHNKTILIDGGGSATSDFDIGENTLIPYILDRGFTKIDIVIVSHFDNDHVGGILTLMEELKVEKIYISKQTEVSNNYNRFLKIAKEKNIKVCEVEAENKIKIEKNLYFDILWPTKQQLTSNVLNNNSVVCKLNYKSFSMLFTGDIEEIAEKQILKEYKNNLQILNSTILKVGHHGSKTSSTQEFLDIVKPKIALIGVGKNNNFGHPNTGVIARLENLRGKNL